MTAWIEDDLRKQLFAAAPADGIWIGDLAEIDSDREIIPVRFAGLDFWFLFLSPHAETGNDPELLLTMLDNLDAKDFAPAQFSRLVKFCRADAEADHFKPDGWCLPEAFQIFQFVQTLCSVMVFYLDEMQEIEQFFYFPASPRLERLYNRTFKALSQRLDGSLVAILHSTGACHAYQRTCRHQHRSAQPETGQHVACTDGCPQGSEHRPAPHA